MTVFDDGSGPALYVGGSFTEAGGVPANNIARWDGKQWSALGVGTNGAVRALAVWDRDGEGPEAPGLYIGGEFTMAGGIPSPYIAKWQGCAACYPDCDTQSGPGVLDIFDFLCFGNRFAANDPYACDCDLSTGPGLCDVFDFLCFGNAFAAGCP
jgi:hypothetical protein